MDDWSLTSFRISKTVNEKSLGDFSLPNYGGELATLFSDYSDSGIDMTQSSFYFRAPEAYLRSQINSYGNRLNYVLTYSGYTLSGKERHISIVKYKSELYSFLRRS
jgi:hypothetical protein